MNDAGRAASGSSESAGIERKPGVEEAPCSLGVLGGYLEASIFNGTHFGRAEKTDFDPRAELRPAGACAFQQPTAACHEAGAGPVSVSPDEGAGRVPCGLL